MNSYNMKDFQNAIVWSYSRVSSKEQFERNSSIETQVMAIKDFASEHHLLITKEFDAAYESSKNLKSQKTLINLIETLKKTPVSKRPKLILLWSPSRFGRSGARAHWSTLTLYVPILTYASMQSVAGNTPLMKEVNTTSQKSS